MTHNYRKGDKVSLLATVRYDQNGDGYVHLEIDGHHSGAVLRPELLTLVAPRIDPGERVRWTNGFTGEAIASHNGSLWVLTEDGRYVVWPATEVTIVQPNHDEPHVAPAIETPPEPPMAAIPTAEAVAAATDGDDDIGF